MELTYAGMTEGAVKIADTIRSDPEKASRMTARELAEASGTGAATVIRYAKNLGYSGYEEMRDFLADSVRSGKRDDIEMTDKESLTQLKHKTVSFDSRFIKETIGNIEEYQLTEAADAIYHAEHVQIAAVGSAAGVAVAAVSIFNTFGIAAEHHMDDLQQCRAAARLKPGDVVIGINYSGSFRGIADTLSAAKESGAAVILITATKLGILSRYADITFLIPVRNYTNQLNIPASVLCQTAVIQMILFRMWQLWPEELSLRADHSGALTKKKTL